jgi:hypothetical protein
VIPLAEGVAGYTGFGVWLLVAVFAFNLAAIPLWFLLGSLRRTHTFRIKEVRTFLMLIEEARGRNGDLNDHLKVVEDAVERAEGLGPLWGRKHLNTARIFMGQLDEQFPEEVGAVWAQMALPTG